MIGLESLTVDGGVVELLVIVLLVFVIIAVGLRIAGR